MSFCLQSNATARVRLCSTIKEVPLHQWCRQNGGEHQWMGTCLSQVGKISLVNNITLFAYIAWNCTGSFHFSQSEERKHPFVSPPQLPISCQRNKNDQIPMQSHPVSSHGSSYFSSQSGGAAQGWASPLRAFFPPRRWALADFAPFLAAWPRFRELSSLPGTLRKPIQALRGARGDRG